MMTNSEAVVEAVQEIAKGISNLSKAGTGLTANQILDMLSMALEKSKSPENKKNPLVPFSSAGEIKHLMNGEIASIADAETEDPDTGEYSEYLIIEIEKNGARHEIAFQDGAWLTNSFPEE